MSGHPRRQEERGAALVIAIGAMTLVLALGSSLLLITMSDTRIVAHYREGVEALHGADAAVGLVTESLMAIPDWNRVLEGQFLSALVDGPAAGSRTLADGSVVDLARATNEARCGQPEGCSETDLGQATPERPWGANNPRWQLYAYGPLASLVAGGTVESRLYVIVWVADDPSETDGNPMADGVDEGNPGRGVLAIRSEAYGLFGARRGVEVTLVREGGVGRMLSWREVR